MTSLTPEVSIVSSLWREDNDLLKRCVESILNQSFKDFEWIIVDDGATASNIELIKSFNDNRIIILKNSRNMGLTASLNRGIKTARGFYIARMDTDDFSFPSRLELQLNFMKLNRDCVLCGSYYQEVTSGKVIAPSVLLVSTDREIRECVSLFNPLAHPTWFFRKDVFDLVGGYNEEYKYSQDYELLTRFLKYGEVNNLKQVLLLRTVAPNRISSLSNREQTYFSLMVRLKLFKNTHHKVEALFSIVKSSLKFLFYPLFQKEVL